MILCEEAVSYLKPFLFIILVAAHAFIFGEIEIDFFYILFFGAWKLFLMNAMCIFFFVFKKVEAPI